MPSPVDSAVLIEPSPYSWSLQGEGQIVGVADSGLDLNHAFFNDPAVNWASSRHRKVLAYYSLPGNDYSDDIAGHGTHVAASIAGKPLPNAAPKDVARFQGMAPEAKIIFHDIGCSAAAADGSAATGSSCQNPGSLNVPVTLGYDIFRVAFTSGARIHSNSWGCSPALAGPDACNSYTVHSQEVDAFSFTHPDFLILFAGGNDGAILLAFHFLHISSMCMLVLFWLAGLNPSKSITYTVGSPGTAKNALVLGASQTSTDGFIEATKVVIVQHCLCFSL